MVDVAVEVQKGEEGRGGITATTTTEDEDDELGDVCMDVCMYVRVPICGHHSNRGLLVQASIHGDIHI
jgi:hypothetical protein